MRLPGWWSHTSTNWVAENIQGESYSSYGQSTIEIMRKKDNQPRLFDGERIRRNRRPYKKVCRSKNDITPHLRFLKTYRMLADSNDGKVKIKELQDKFRIGHFARSAMPVDILTINEAEINEAYAKAWRKSLFDYYNDCDRLQRTETYTPTSPIIMSVPVKAEPSLADVLAEIESATQSFITEMENKINTFKTLLTTKTTSL